MNILDQITQSLLQTIKALFDVNQETINSIEITLNTDEHKQQFGDLSTNAAMQLAKKLGANPRIIAQKIIENFFDQQVNKLEIAGPGFINIFLSPEAVTSIACDLFNDTAKALCPEIKKYSYDIEFVSANPTGPLHIGHGRNAIIGDVLARVLRFVGNTVTTEFYINDAGSQITKLGESFKARCMQILGQEYPVPEDGYHGEYLIELAREAVQQFGETLKQRSLEFFAEYAKNKLLTQQQNTLKKYKIEFDIWFSEKTLHTSGAIEKSLTKLQEAGFLYQADGATWFRSTQFGDDKDRVVKKQSGELTYVAADIAYLEHKLSRVQKLVIVLGQDHHSYVVRLKGIMQALGYDPDNLTVILYQLVTIKESGEYVRLSKRAGRIIDLADIIETVGSDVARFFYLHRKADAHLELDMDLALKHTDENPVYYIQYAYVRIISILEKAQTLEKLHQIQSQDISHLSTSEVLLLKKILALESTLKNIAQHYQTHVLAYYAYDLARAFHHFYAHNRVIDQDNITISRQRIALLKILKQTLQICLELLGLSTPQSM